MPEFFDGPADLPDPRPLLPVIRARAHRRHIRNVVLTTCSAVLVLAGAAVSVGLAAAGAGGGSGGVHVARPPSSHASESPSASQASSRTAADISITPDLLRQVRDSYYAAYRADPQAARDFGVRAATSGDVTNPTISHAGVIRAARSTEDAYWVVAAICFSQNLIGCQDAGSYQVFNGVGLGGPLQYLGFAPCRIPLALAARWYPRQQYPMGATCPAANSESDQTFIGVVTTTTPRLCLGRAAATGDCFTATPQQLNNVRIGDCVSVKYAPLSNGPRGRIKAITALAHRPAWCHL